MGAILALLWTGEEMAATDAAPPTGQSKVLSPDCSSAFPGLAHLGSNWVLHPPLTNHHGGCVWVA